MNSLVVRLRFWIVNNHNNISNASFILKPFGLHYAPQKKKEKKKHRWLTKKMFTKLIVWKCDHFFYSIWKLIIFDHNNVLRKVKNQIKWNLVCLSKPRNGQCAMWHLMIAFLLQICFVVLIAAVSSAPQHEPARYPAGVNPALCPGKIVIFFLLSKNKIVPHKNHVYKFFIKSMSFDFVPSAFFCFFEK